VIARAGAGGGHREVVTGVVHRELFTGRSRGQRVGSQGDQEIRELFTGRSTFGRYSPLLDLLTSLWIQTSL
jgi:hypothetical protein